MPAYYPDETGKLGEIYDLTKRKAKPNDPAATRASICACGEGDMRGGLAVGEPSERVLRAVAAYP